MDSVSSAMESSTTLETPDGAWLEQIPCPLVSPESIISSGTTEEEEEQREEDLRNQPVELPSPLPHSSNSKEDPKPLAVQSLPLDSLHCIASFLTPNEWCNSFGNVNKGFHSIAKEIVRIVKLHGFKCATEVITAWKTGQYEDARELAALYISKGVPIYTSRCLGHAFHTVNWRMKVECNETEETVDPFYGTARTDFRTQHGHGRKLTYLEEKSLFYVQRVTGGAMDDSESSDSGLVPRVHVLIHQHLLDQHQQSNSFVDDRQGRMISPLTSLSTDFFHPTKKDKPVQLELPDVSWNDEEHHELLAPPPPVLTSALGSVELQVYSTSAIADDTLRRQMKVRFASYHRRLETLLSKSDNSCFEDCMLDFWDEFFPETAGIHYHDLSTAVPRLINLHRFLTKPCPKAIGAVQCEIERIKINSNKGGVTGRLFPTYEYRLFIRNRPPNIAGDSPESANSAETENFVRRDTLLMVAKNRGRKHTEGVVSSSHKKGSNNYYLYMPQQRDVDAHFTKVNDTSETPARLVPNGASLNPVLVSEADSNTLLGRLQSNFIGTEFQIFTPHLRKLPRPKPICCSEDEDYDSGMSSDTTKQRSRWLSLRSSRPGSESGSTTNADTSPPPPKGPPKRSLSSPDVGTKRTNRRAIADAPQTAMCEEEDGAITYTANLLGSRPRIMDVCIPKVGLDGTAGLEWQRYLGNCEDMDDCHMLSCFRRLLARTQEDDEDEEDPIDHDFGLMALQNRPPWWNVELGSFVLNFGGRVSVASVKNFQLCERTNHDLIMLQFGRIKGRHAFTMDFQHPLTAVQAFSIAISSLQSKISFG